jgi:hypothetical protein
MVSLRFGGGSTTGLCKAIALRTDLPQIVAPSTYAGSEMTPIIGETRDGVKTTQTSARVLPEVVIYDVDLTLSLPPAQSGVSGMNAIAHVVEAIYARDCNPVINLIAAEGIRALALALPTIVIAPRDREARANALYGAWLCGTCLGAVGMALHHKLCHTLGGSFDLPHAETHTAVLPHATAYNAPATPEAMRVIAEALGTTDAPCGLYYLASRLGAKMALKDLGFPEDGIDRAAEAALSILTGTRDRWSARQFETSSLAPTPESRREGQAQAGLPGIAASFARAIYGDDGRLRTGCKTASPRNDRIRRRPGEVSANIVRTLLCSFRSAVVRVRPRSGGMLSLRPDTASLATGSCNFPTMVYENSPELIEWLASEMANYGLNRKLTRSTSP